MKPRPRIEAPLSIGALLFTCALVLGGLSRFGIWDPWEIEVAESARRLAEGADDMASAQVGPILVGYSLRVLGIDEWTGRLPIALSAILFFGLLYALVRRFADARSAVYAVVVAGTSPLLLFNARTMLGEAPAFALQTAIVLCAACAIFGAQDAVAEAPARLRRLGWLVAAVALFALTVRARGALLGALPPLAAVVLAAVIAGKLRARATDPIGFACTLLLGAVAVVTAAAIANAVIADQAGYHSLLGGMPQGGQPPSFEVIIGHTFHAFAPWSALLPLALARLAFAPQAPEDQARPPSGLLPLVSLLWLALGYAALTLFLSRYGDRAAVFPIGALAVAVALLLRDMERSRNSDWPAAIAGGLLAALLLRDYALYPSSPLHGLPVAEVNVPEVFNPRGYWSLVLGLFGAAVVLGFGAYEDAPQRPLREQLLQPYRLIAAQFRQGRAFQAWLALFALALLAFEVFGLLSFVAAKPLHISTLGAKWGKRLMLLPPAIPIAVAALQCVVYGYRRLRELRCLPILAAGGAFGLYAAFGFMPALSAHFSPREVYETYNELAREGEPLVEYKVGARAAAYYAKGNATAVDTLAPLMDQLVGQRRIWAVFPTEELAAIDRTFRGKTQRHLFVADARSAKVTLATNQPVPGRENESFIAQFVKHEVPAMQQRVDGNFDDKIMLLGYDLKLPHGDHVGAGESFEVTWYWKALRAVPGSYRIFVHFDAESMRIHGDHDPVDGRYPIRLWDAQDVIIDKQRIDVPPNYPAGPYTIYIGVYSGDTRLTVKEGRRDDANRLIAGVLRIR